MECHFVASKNFENKHSKFFQSILSQSQSLQQVIDFCLDSDDSDIDSSIGGLYNGEEDWIDKEMLQKSQWDMER